MSTYISRFSRYTNYVSHRLDADPTLNEIDIDHIMGIVDLHRPFYSNIVRLDRALTHREAV